MSQRPIRLVLDTSAVLAYGRGDAVGETLREVHLNEAAFTVPLGCLASAGRNQDASTRVRRTDQTVITPYARPSLGESTLAIAPTSSRILSVRAAKSTLAAATAA